MKLIHLFRVSDLNEQSQVVDKRSRGFRSQARTAARSLPARAQQLVLAVSYIAQGLEPTKGYSQSAGRVNIGLRPYAKYCRTMSNR